ncbi:MAG: sugar phosphate isomerase/epimerase [Clostridia bacterium]|nr:sugar phosphate isomerase/epimerase [Clostridia bacterium]
MKKIILSAFADEYSESFDEQLFGLSELGISYLELRHADGINVSAMDNEKIEEIRSKLQRANIGVSAIGSPLGKISTDGDIDGELKKAEKIFGFANELECKYIRMFSFYPSDKLSDAQNRDTVYSTLEKMIGLSEKYGVTLCHENETKIYGESPERCIELLDHFGGRMKCVFDMGNFLLGGYPPYPSTYELLKPYIEYFHIKDGLSAGAIVPPGCGEASIKEIIADHAKSFDGKFFISLEPHLQTFSGLNALVAEGTTFDNPYKYPDLKTAFIDAAGKLKEIVENI